jgi:sulfur-carrier protein adenylyltransferase/sulfurtransferase
MTADGGSADPHPRLREAWPAEAEQLIAAGAALLDTREPHEWQSGVVAGANLVRPAEVEMRARDVLPDPDRPVVVYCAHGHRSLVAAQRLVMLGYREVVSMAGGITAWRQEGRPVALPGADGTSRSRADERYARQLVMPEIGPAGQAALARARVLVVGAGGLGSPALLYLAAAGVGTIGVVDFDVVDRSNLQRQIVHADARVGVRKTESAAQAIGALNPDVHVLTHDETLTAANAARLIAGYDVVIDGTDTFDARYALNDAAVRAGTPVIHASVFRFEGQLTVFAPPAGPCYRCLYPAPPPPELAPACSVAGVLGVVPGVLGLLQATEAIKLILGLGRPLIGRLLTWDSLDGTFSEIEVRRDPACATCGELVRVPSSVGAGT